MNPSNLLPPSCKVLLKKYAVQLIVDPDVFRHEDRILLCLERMMSYLLYEEEKLQDTHKTVPVTVSYPVPKTSWDYLKVFLQRIFPYLTAPLFCPQYFLKEETKFVRIAIPKLKTLVVSPPQDSVILLGNFQKFSSLL